MEMVKKRIENHNDIVQLGEFNEINKTGSLDLCPVHNQTVKVEYEEGNPPIPIFMGCCMDAVDKEIKRRIK